MPGSNIYISSLLFFMQSLPGLNLKKNLDGCFMNLLFNGLCDPANFFTGINISFYTQGIMDCYLAGIMPCI